MTELQRMALRQAIGDMLAARDKYAATDTWREKPLTSQEKADLFVQGNRLLGSAKDWIEAVIDGDEGEDN